MRKNAWSSFIDLARERKNETIPLYCSGNDAGFCGVTLTSEGEKDSNGATSCGGVVKALEEKSKSLGADRRMLVKLYNDCGTSYMIEECGDKCRDKCRDQVLDYYRVRGPSSNDPSAIPWQPRLREGADKWWLSFHNSRAIQRGSEVRWEYCPVILEAELRTDI